MLNAPVGVEDGRVITPSEELADLREGLGAVLAEEVHRDVAGVGDVSGAGGTGNVIRREVKGMTDRL